MSPICIMNGCALWYSPDESGYYWQDENGTGYKTSCLYPTAEAAIQAMRKGKVKLKD